MASTEDTMILDTTKGRVVIAMRPDLAPGHVARIKELVREGFYDGIVFHRVIDGFMAQTGCPHGTGTGGSGKKLKAEFNAEPHVRGTVSMARAQDPNSGDSQFFICFDDATFLDRQYTAWGNVIEGWTTSTRSSAVSRCAIPTRSSRRRWRLTRRSRVLRFRSIESGTASAAVIAGLAPAIHDDCPCMQGRKASTCWLASWMPGSSPGKTPSVWLGGCPNNHAHRSV